MARARILIVEDERQTVDELRDHLELHGYETEVALTVPISLSIVEERKMDLAVVGEELQGVSGLDILHKLKELSPSLKVVLMTAQKSKRYQASLVKSGAEGVLTQPLDRDSALKLVDEALARPEPEAVRRKRPPAASKIKKAKARPRAKAKKNTVAKRKVKVRKR